MAGKIPGPYLDQVPAEGADKIMVYPPFDNMDIGARKSGTRDNRLSGIRSLDHVGGTQGASGKEGK